MVFGAFAGALAVVPTYMLFPNESQMVHGAVWLVVSCVATIFLVFSFHRLAERVGDTIQGEGRKE